MTYLEDADFFVRIVRLPRGIKGAVTLNSDGTYNVYLSDLLDFECRLDVYIHEWLHIENDDFFNDKPIYIVEAS